MSRRRDEGCHRAVDHTLDPSQDAHVQARKSTIFSEDVLLLLWKGECNLPVCVHVCVLLSCKVGVNRPQ